MMRAQSSTPRVSRRAWPTGKRGSIFLDCHSATNMTTWETWGEV